MPNPEVFGWIRKNFFPHIWCPGCGNGVVMHSLIRAFIKLGLDPAKTVLASGIGCSSRMPGHINACTVHTTHGRSLAFATGIKMFKPELTVVDVMGDGDCTAIGGNHFIHSCRRNIDMTAIILNNNIYGMTGGQASPTTPDGAWASTTPWGAVDPSFDICKLAEGAGASYVARTTMAAPIQIEQFITKGIKNKGFSVIEVSTNCHTYFGRKNNRKTPIENYNFFKQNSVPLSKAKEMSKEELKGKIVCGEFLTGTDVPEYVEKYDEVIKRAGGK